MSVFIIAEAGVNHNGSIELAYELIDVAFESGADAIKFQTFKAENLALKGAEKAEYQKYTSNPDESQFEMLKKLELNSSDHENLYNYCKKKGIVFLSSPFDIESVQLLESLNIDTIKIPSGEITNYPYLDYIGKLSKKIILSSGMSDLNEINDALNVLISSGTAKSKITILHANTMYPSPMIDVNLKAMLTIKNKFNIDVGYSDHTLGAEVSIAAVALGASVIEKHFTLSQNLEGPDHKASLSPDELKHMITSIRNIELAMGDGKKNISASEKLNIDIVRKSIVAKSNIKKGDILSENNLTTKRPGFGTNPMKWKSIIGSVAKKSYKADDLL